MKLIIDRGSTNKKFYTIGFGVDFDTLIFVDTVWIGGVNPETLSEMDRIVTKSAELKWCVMLIKHPLLLENSNEDSAISKFFVDENIRHTLREYFTIRLIHHRYHVELIEIGKRLFI